MFPQEILKLQGWWPSTSMSETLQWRAWRRWSRRQRPRASGDPQARWEDTRFTRSWDVGGFPESAFQGHLRSKSWASEAVHCCGALSSMTSFALRGRKMLTVPIWLSSLFKTLGWVLSEDPEKDKGLASTFTALGVEFDLTQTHDGVLRIGNTQKRRDELAAMVQGFLDTDRLTCAESESLRSRLTFAEGQVFGRSAKLALRAVGSPVRSGCDCSPLSEDCFLVCAGCWTELYMPHRVKLRLRRSLLSCCSSMVLVNQQMPLGSEWPLQLGQSWSMLRDGAWNFSAFTCLTKLWMNGAVAVAVSLCLRLKSFRIFWPFHVGASCWKNATCSFLLIMMEHGTAGSKGVRTPCMQCGWSTKGPCLKLGWKSSPISVVCRQWVTLQTALQGLIFGCVLRLEPKSSKCLWMSFANVRLERMWWMIRWGDG